MKSEQYLESIRNWRFKIIQLKKLRDEVNDAMIRTQSLSPNPDRVQSSPRADKLEMEAIRAVERIAALDKQIRQSEQKYFEKKHEVIEKISRMKDGQCRRFLIDYYLDGLSEAQIKREYKFSNDNSIYVLRRRAIKYFADVNRKEKQWQK